MKKFRKILLSLALIFVIAFPFVLAGCNEVAGFSLYDLQNAAFRSAENYFATHQDHETYQDITYTMTEKSVDNTYKVISYKQKATDEEKTLHTVEDKTEKNQTMTVAIKKTEEGFVAKITIVGTETTTVNTVENDLLKVTVTPSTYNETFYVLSVGEGEDKQYVITWDCTSKYGTAPETTQKNYTVLADADAMEEVMKSLIAKGNAAVYDGFYMSGAIGEMPYFAGSMNFNKDGNKIDVSLAMQWGGIGKDDVTGYYSAASYPMELNMTFVNEKASSLKLKRGYSYDEGYGTTELTLKISNSANVGTTSLEGRGSSSDMAQASFNDDVISAFPTFAILF